MPLSPTKERLLLAASQHYALPLFDTFDMFSTEGMFQAFEEQHAPGMIALYGGSFDQPSAPALAAYIRTRAEAFPYPISLMLDHGASFEQCIRAIRIGFTDVMFDGSRLPLEENIATTQAVVARCPCRWGRR